QAARLVAAAAPAEQALGRARALVRLVVVEAALVHQLELDQLVVDDRGALGGRDRVVDPDLAGRDEAVAARVPAHGEVHVGAIADHPAAHQVDAHAALASDEAAQRQRPQRAASAIHWLVATLE